MNVTWVVLGSIAVIGFLFVTLYNRLVALRQTRKNAFADIDVQLKQRFNLIPQLVETVKGYAKHEQTVFENVTAARAGVSTSDDGPSKGRMQAESALSGAMMNLFAVAENYPELKADGSFQKLMNELSDIEDKVAAARRFFNSATSEINTAVQQFPSNVVAGLFGFSAEEFFEIDEANRAEVEKAPEVKF